MSSVKVSVIIPVKNQEKHISLCLESVTKQTLQEIEIIVIEGGSSDQTADIICQHMDRDPRIHLLICPDQGLSLARQAGLKKAKGDYILYLDGDDTLAPDALELLHRRGDEADADMVVLNFWIENQYNQTTKESSSMSFVRLSGINFIRTLYQRQNYWMVWSVLHKRDLYTRNDIRFEADLYLGEDTLLTTQLAYFSRKVVKVNCKPLLHHYIRRAPEEKKMSFSEKDYFDLETFPELIRNFLKDKPEYEVLEESIDCLRLQAIIRSFSYNYFDCACEKSREALHILHRHPSLGEISGKRMKRIFRAFSVSEPLGRLMSKLLL
ncbi:MAG: glycosyltransferase family 2 protein [Bacteroidales bacterium]